LENVCLSERKEVATVLICFVPIDSCLNINTSS